MTPAPDPAGRPGPVPDVALAERLFAELAERTADTEGVTRMSYGPGEATAHAIVRREAEALGLRCETDAACNLYMSLPGAAPGPRIVIGSHLDSVPMGGNYDGAAGVLMGLSVVAGMVADGTVPPLPVTVMAIRAEESAWFNASYIGSRAALGRLGARELESVKRAGDGVSLGPAIADAGGRPDDLAAGRAHLSPDDLALFVEPHIEQGPVLVQAGQPVGIVTDIRGSLRHRHAVCKGAYSHSGTTPYEGRRDAVRAVATLVVELDRMWTDARTRGRDLTVTVGEFSTAGAAASFSKVAGLVRFSLDIRSDRADVLAEAGRGLDRLVDEIAAAQNVGFDMGPRTSTAPAAMHPAVIAALDAAAAALDVPARRMPCGAGHDAATFAACGVPTGMLFLRNEHGSHNPRECMEMADFASGAAVLMRLCLDPPDLRP